MQLCPSLPIVAETKGAGPSSRHRAPVSGGFMPTIAPALLRRRWGPQGGVPVTARPLANQPLPVILLLRIGDDDHRIADQLVIEAVALAEYRAKNLGVTFGQVLDCFVDLRIELITG